MVISHKHVHTLEQFSLHVDKRPRIIVLLVHTSKFTAMVISHKHVHTSEQFSLQVDKRPRIKLQDGTLLLPVIADKTISLMRVRYPTKHVYKHTYIHMHMHGEIAYLSRDAWESLSNILVKIVSCCQIISYYGESHTWHTSLKRERIMFITHLKPLQPKTWLDSWKCNQEGQPSSLSSGMDGAL